MPPTRRHSDGLKSSRISTAYDWPNIFAFSALLDQAECAAIPPGDGDRTSTKKLREVSYCRWRGVAGASKKRRHSISV
jgi:hypothetical protein